MIPVIVRKYTPSSVLLYVFPVQLTTSRIGNLTRLIHTLLYVMTTGYSTKIYSVFCTTVRFPCSADHEQDWQPYPVDPYSAICDDHTYIQVSLIPPWEDQREWHRMTRMTRPDCAVMCNLINIHTYCKRSGLTFSFTVRTKNN